MGVDWSTAPTGRSSATRPQTSLARIGTSPASHCAAARSPEVKPFGVPTPQTVTLSIVEDPVLELVLQLRQEQWLSRSRNAWNNGCSSILYYSVFQYLVPKMFPVSYWTCILTPRAPCSDSAVAIVTVAVKVSVKVALKDTIRTNILQT